MNAPKARRHFVRSTRGVWRKIVSDFLWRVKNVREQLNKKPFDSKEILDLIGIALPLRKPGETVVISTNPFDALRVASALDMHIGSLEKALLDKDNEAHLMSLYDSLVSVMRTWQSQL